MLTLCIYLIASIEKLDLTQRESIKKVSNIRLSAKLLEVGVDESQIQAMDRVQMIAAWAEIFSERTTLRSLYAISRPSVVCCLSVCDVGAPYSGG